MIINLCTLLSETYKIIQFFFKKNLKFGFNYRTL